MDTGAGIGSRLELAVVTATVSNSRLRRNGFDCDSASIWANICQSFVDRLGPRVGKSGFGGAGVNRSRRGRKHEQGCAPGIRAIDGARLFRDQGVREST